MKRKTMDYGIDLGTTNSVIALFESGVCTVFRNGDDELTPSVFRLDEEGKSWVGKKAYARLPYDRENTADQFKMLMGKRQNKKFIRSGRIMSPEELSAEVLKELKIVVREWRDEDVKACVITVPANFGALERAATQRASKLAGIEHVAFINEPIAASIAYAMEKNTKNGYWLVYDFGGGTFDLALVSLEDGHLSVLDHEGVQQLGGSDFDKSIVNSIVIHYLKAQYDLEDLNLSNTYKYGTLIACATHKAEEAKIDLSRREESIIELQFDGPIKDNNGRQISARIPITRKQYEPLIMSDIEKTVKLCEKVLSGHHLKRDDIQKMILVGGPTKTPYLKHMLQQALGISLEFSINPMTVVAQGAAIFASSQFISDKPMTVDKSKMPVKLEYDPMTNVTEPLVAGTIEDYASLIKQKGQVSLMLRREGGGWESGKLNVQKDGKFAIRVRLREDKQMDTLNVFYLTFFDEFGNAIPSDPEAIQITHGIVVDPSRLNASIGVELEDGSFSKHIEKGELLPARGMGKYKATRLIKSGTEDVALNIIVYQGEYQKAEINRWIGTVKITGKDVSRDISENAEIKIILKVDVNGLPTVSAEVMGLIISDRKLYDEHGQPVDIRKIVPDIQVLENEIEKQKQRLQEIKEVTLIDTNASVEEKGKIEEIEKKIQSQSISRDVLAAKGGDQRACEKLDEEVRALRNELDQAEYLNQWPMLVLDYQEALKAAQWSVEKFGQEEDRGKMGILQSEYEVIREDRNRKRIEKLTEELWGMYWIVCMRKDEWWISQFKNFEKGKNNFSNQDRAKTLLVEGSHALQTEDIESLREIMHELWGLVSRDAQKQSSIQIIDSGLRK